jgi:hypothetical protein
MEFALEGGGSEDVYIAYLLPWTHSKDATAAAVETEGPVLPAV